MRKSLFSLLLLFIISFQSTFAQPIGLQFGSHETQMDQRTGLKLMDGKKLNVNDELELTVDVYFNRSPKHYFGYILRMIDDNHRNLDIVYNYKSDRFNDFSIIYDHQLTPIKFNFEDRRNAMNKWRKLKLKIDLKNNLIALSLNDRTYDYKFKGEIPPIKGLKFYFGANYNPYFKVHDVPPMIMKNLRIKADHHTYEWPLDEKEGNIAHCKTDPSFDGKVIHPIWIKATHSNWELTMAEKIQGGLYCYLKEHSALLYVQDNVLYKRNFQSGETVRLGDLTLDLKPDVRTRMIKKGNKLIIYNLKKDVVYTYDLITKVVQKENIDYPISKTATHHAQWISDNGANMFIFGGYGNHEFSNKFVKYNFNKKVFTPIEINGDVITPRYYTGVGKAGKGHVYLLGGYGSVTGQQIINPQNFYDLYDFNENTNELKKILTWETPPNSYVSSRSVVVDTQNQELFALTFDNHKFVNELTLRNYDLKSGKMKAFPKVIPFQFNDTKVVVDLQFDTKYKKLHVILIEKVGKESQFKVYSLNLMGGFYIPEVEEVTADSSEETPWELLLIVVALILVVGGVVIWKRTKKQSVEVEPTVSTEEVKPTITPPAANKEKEKVEEAIPVVEVKKPEVVKVVKVKKSTINFFGGFRIFDSEGKDISNEFTPLIKQLFILITISQYINGRGVSADKMINLFWYDMPLSKARNNRGVNLTKLRRLCKTIGEVKFLKDADFWKLEIGDDVHIPFFDLKDLLESPQTKENLMSILEILDTGKLLLGTDYEWMEEMKAEIVNHLIETLYGYLTSSEVKLSNQEKLKISDTILQYDHIHEEATLIKCQLLSSQGMHSVAKDIFNKFKDEYESIYDEKFDMQYNEFLREMGSTY
ncbi:kelch repeat-containing protein [Flammeovirga sp. OC4]|uniref:Kelch repeat-containing protein n=1 Tax=Flammeovirga sp. OC4 TaxID=1382345 RepID=UPI0005C5AD6B|nr:kelch repeat-containing protein [Flammeovirga sp. OC4]